ncbi:2-oxo-4-hydroxy-4-carboxy-5-ureidoimidazoline decarboxylase [Actinokineospora inagensis]|uniref:2-oxo-4-hydroxy-4-carboxy-5-ureidoimidazoline decarboxylase n=1 Tax=Actinokineospora inagensis TaxID=103730 RepID=UPI0004246FD0
MASLLEVVNGGFGVGVVDGLGRCCGSRRWVGEGGAQRPFRSLGELDEVSAAVLATLDWAEVLVEVRSVGRVRDRWPGLGRAELIYEWRFGHRFVICGRGLTRDAALGALRHRSGHDRGTERAVVVGELARIVAVRLRGLVL